MSLSDFLLGNQLGEGSYGSVCIVKRKLDNKIYAMKRVKIAQLCKSEKEASLNEIRLLASLEHPNIIEYNEAFFDHSSQTLNIVMEYADDGDLASKIKYNNVNGLMFTENIIWDYFIQILYGLKYLHDNKIMHRDLKSANLFLMKNGTVKIGDLNVSKLIKFGMAHTKIGTPYYASPEIWADKPYDYKCDIWSVGCIIYEMCQLKPPFRGTSIKDLNKNIQAGKYESIPSYYSKELTYVISKILVVNPMERADCDSLLTDDIILRKIREINKEKGGIVKNEGHINLMKTIKMPKNLKEINKALPMKRYKKKQKEEMMENDGYESMKRLLQEHNKNNRKDIQEMPEFFEDNNSNYQNKVNGILPQHKNNSSNDSYKIYKNVDSNNKNIIYNKNNLNHKKHLVERNKHQSKPVKSSIQEVIINKKNSNKYINDKIPNHNNMQRNVHINKININGYNNIPPKNINQQKPKSNTQYSKRNQLLINNNLKRPNTGYEIRIKNIPRVNNSDNPKTPVSYQKPKQKIQDNSGINISKNKKQFYYPQSANYNKIKKRNNFNNKRYNSPHNKQRNQNNDIKKINEMKVIGIGIKNHNMKRNYQEEPKKKKKVVIEKYYYIPKQNKKGQGSYEKAKEYEKKKKGI